jgi:hypothetical protein
MKIRVLIGLAAAATISIAHLTAEAATTTYVLDHPVDLLKEGGFGASWNTLPGPIKPITLTISGTAKITLAGNVDSAGYVNPDGFVWSLGIGAFPVNVLDGYLQLATFFGYGEFDQHGSDQVIEYKLSESIALDWTGYMYYPSFFDVGPYFQKRFSWSFASGIGEFLNSNTTGVLRFDLTDFEARLVTPDEVTAVPEPSTWAALLAGVSLMLFARVKSLKADLEPSPCNAPQV